MTAAVLPSTSRCFGTGDPLVEHYHDEEWGRPVRDDVSFFERIVLEGFQAGLSWVIILRKREGFREAFHDWDVRRIAGYGEADIRRLLADPNIVRNRKKIEATIANAQALVALWDAGDSLSDLIWSHSPRDPVPGRPRSWDEVPTESAESRALAKALKARGFVFVGPVTMFALMQACGLIDCHLESCPVETGHPSVTTGHAHG